jgi:cyclopropane fatty-acyl-phospholipid synthase-like methyltransferase
MELAYWRNASRAESDARQRKILELWGFAGAQSVLEIGTGPWGGCLPFVEAECKAGIDPLYDEYARAGLLDMHPAIWRCLQPIEMIEFRAEFDAVLSMNALDHGESDFGSIARVPQLLYKGGRFYLHVHLRRPDQLNVGHDHPLYLEDLDAATAAAGLREIKKDVYEVDPVEGCAYRTVIGVWEKC